MADRGAMTDGPIVSVILPTFNRERYIAQAVESVFNQTFRELEIIVVDDGSTDGTASVVARYPGVHYVYQSNGGIGAARNRGVEAARGRFLAFLDSDDLWSHDKLAIQMAALREDPAIDVLYGHARQFRDAASGGQSVQCVGDAVPGYLPGAMLVRAEAFAQVGPFGTGWNVGEAMDWHLRAVEAGLCVVMLPDVVLFRRLHDSNQGIRRRDARSDYVRILKASLDRRRASDGVAAVRTEVPGTEPPAVPGGQQ